MNPYLAEFISSILWTFSTQVYSKLVAKLSVFRFNFYKAVIGFFCFLIVALFQGNLFPASNVILILLLSGLLGFVLADLLIFYSFSKNGPARTLMIMSFSPATAAIYSYFILGQVLPFRKSIGIIFMILCIISLALEKIKNRDISIRIVIMTLIGMNLDSVGVIFSKKAFLMDPTLTSINANVFRILPAIIILFIINKFKNVNLSIKEINFDTKLKIITSCFFGTFLALYLFLYAISKAIYPSVIIAIGSLTPIYASIYEHILTKKAPNLFFLIAIVNMLIGVYFIIS